MKRVHEILQTSYAYQRNIRGANVGIAVLDTGIVRHPDLNKHIRYFQDFVQKRNFLYDDCGHGTHIAGILAGDGTASNGQYTGIAPESDLIALKVLDRNGNGTVGAVMAGLHWILMHHKEYKIRVVNISVGTVVKEDGDEDSQLVQAVNEVWDEGLVVCVAAGNNGPLPSSVTTPGISRKVITVGSSDYDDPVEIMGAMIADYSGRGPNSSCIMKPDLVAPGSNITSCRSDFRATFMRRGNPYIKKSGTSMSTPIVSGAVALLLSAYPNLSNGEVKRLLCESAVDMGLENNRQGFGLVNIEQLFTFAERI